MKGKEKLSDRVRPNSEAAPWVVEEIKKLENDNERLEKERKDYHRKFCQERQRNMDSKPTQRSEVEIQKLQTENEKIKSFFSFLCECEFITETNYKCRFCCYLKELKEGKK